MANFVVVVDPDPERREKFAHTASSVLPLVSGLVAGECRVGNFQACWAVGPRAPVSECEDGKSAGILWGEAFSEAGDLSSATAIRNLWNARDNGIPPPCDGFHAAVAYSSEVGLTVGADLLGLFPLYYWSNGAVVIVASSVATIRYHPLVQASFNPAGLAGVLLANGLVDGQTLWKGILRLKPGHLLRWQPGTQARELLQYKPPAPGPGIKEPLAHQIRRIHAALDQAIRRHRLASRKCGLLLSGGRDSRMLAGYLARHRAEVHALTLGIWTDFEVPYARRVSLRLGMPHDRFEVPANEYARGAQLLARWDQLASGFTNVLDWGAFPRLTHLPDRVVLGVLGDAIVGGSYLDEMAFATDSTNGFAHSLEAMHRRGFQPEVLGRLLRQDVFGDSVNEAIEHLRAAYGCGPDEASQQAFHLALGHRERFHVGSMAWACSFWSWPVLPLVDRGVLDAISSISYSRLARRRVQDALLVKQFPSLAALPLDRNSYSTTPLLPGQGYKIAARLRQLFRLSPHPEHPILERRYYYRVWDLNNLGWRHIRQESERSRERAYDFFNRGELDHLLPAADKKVQSNDIVLSSGIKTILGFLLWLEQYATNLTGTRR